MSDLQGLLEHLVHRHPDLTTIAEDTQLRQRYLTFVVVFCVGALRGYCATSFRPRDLEASNLIEAVLGCASIHLADCLPFSPLAFRALSDQFDALMRAAQVARMVTDPESSAEELCMWSEDSAVGPIVRADAAFDAVEFGLVEGTEAFERALLGGISPTSVFDDFAAVSSPKVPAGGSTTLTLEDSVVSPTSPSASPISPASAAAVSPKGRVISDAASTAMDTPARLNIPRWALDRIAEGHIRPLASGKPGWLAFEDFVALALSEKDRMGGPSIDYWCRVFDTDDDGRIGRGDMWQAVKQLSRHQAVREHFESQRNAMWSHMPSSDAVSRAVIAAVSFREGLPTLRGVAHEEECLCAATLDRLSGTLGPSTLQRQLGVFDFSISSKEVRKKRCGGALFEALVLGESRPSVSSASM
jgi:hypothetical protein